MITIHFIIKTCNYDKFHPSFYTHNHPKHAHKYNSIIHNSIHNNSNHDYSFISSLKYVISINFSINHFTHPIIQNTPIIILYFITQFTTTLTMITLIYFIIKTCNLQNSSIYLNYYGRPSKEFNEIHIKSCSIWQFLLPLISNSVPPSIHIKALIVFYFFKKKNFHTLFFFRGFPCLLTDVYTQLISTFN